MALSADDLADRQQIVEVIDRHRTALDSKNYERLKTCFSEDARRDGEWKISMRTLGTKWSARRKIAA